MPARETVKKLRTGRTELVLQKKIFLPVAHVVLWDIGPQPLISQANWGLRKS